MVVNNCPLVTIITPVYNGAEYLEELIQSVVRQDYPNIEHIIIDDGSQDNGKTVSILQKYPHLHSWSRPNQGQYATMNEGILAAQGEIICFVNADDTVAPDAVKTAVEHIQKQPHLDGVFGSTSYMDGSGNDYPYWLPFRMAPIRFYPYFAHISHCSLYIKKNSIQQHGLSFDPALRFVGDYEWMIRIHKAGLHLGVVRQALSKVRIHTEQTSQKNSEASALEARRVLNAQRINKVTYFLFSMVNLFLLRAWKFTRLLKEIGVRGMIAHLTKRNSHT
jgi:glycosyltransferase involved in cell wall biosynthesis